MCDYSLHAVKSRPAVVDDHLVVTRFPDTFTHGLTHASDPETAVCLRPGTEVAFDKPVIVNGMTGPLECSAVKDQLVGRFVKVDEECNYAHHDAIEFPNGKRVLITTLATDQALRVLQLPPGEQPVKAAEAVPRPEVERV